MKIALIGLGKVGINAAFMLSQKSFVQDLIISSRGNEKAEGIALDLFHCSPELDTRVRAVSMDDLESVKGSDLVIISAGVQRVDGQSRTDVALQNKTILKEIFRKIKDPASKTLYLIVTNPVDTFTYLAWQELGVSADRVFGLGTIIDGMRYQAYLARELDISPAKVKCKIVGEHGEKMVFIRNSLTVEGTDVPEDSVKEAFHAARSGGGQLIKLIKGTHFAASLCIAKVAEAVFQDDGEAFPLVTVYNYPGVGDVGLSLPVELGRKGIKNVLPLTGLTIDEQEALDSAALSLHARQVELLG